MKTLRNLLVVAMLISIQSTFTSCSDDEQLETVEEINKSKEEEIKKLKDREKNSTTKEQLVDPKDVKPPTNG